MNRAPLLVTLALLATVPLAATPAAAQSGVKPKSTASHIAPMHPHQLTLYPHGKPKPRSPTYSYHRHRFDQPTAIHNTFVGPRY
jgi:hypothetical protein